MCGIFGLFRFDGQPVEVSSLERVCVRMAHRGPDGDGFFVSGPFGMGMRRLAIIDLEGGQQPIASEDGRYQVILNGEIYNYVELRKELEASGHKFRSKSDTEVIVHLFEEHGPEAVNALDGMFAFAVWDDLEKELFVFRDRIGVKPLFYSVQSSFFTFCSDLAAMRTVLPSVSVNAESFLSYLGLGYVPWPASMLNGMHKIPPGSYLRVRKGTVSLTRYWDLNPADALQFQSTAEYQEALLPVISAAVQRQMRSDVPVGVFLSGGIDSAAVLGLASQTGNQRMKSFSIGFEDGFNELPSAQSVATRFGTEHHSTVLKTCEVLPILEELLPYLDEPIADNSLVPSYMVSKLAFQHGVPVVLTGAGGDEIFGGYCRYLPRGRAGRALHMLPSRLRALAGRAYGWMDEDLGYRVGSESLDFLLATSGASLGFLRKAFARPESFASVLGLLRAHFENGVRGDAAGARSLMSVDLRSYLVDDVLALTDKMTMATSVEARVPLLDHQFVELCRRIPERVLFRERKLKALEKDLFSSLLPAGLLKLPKMGFSGPTTKWTSEPRLRSMLQRNLAERPTAFLKEYFRVEAIREALRSVGRNWYIDTTIWSLFIFDSWYRHHVDSSYA